MLSKKVILIGNFGVGKTSLISQFVYQKFSDKYLTTLGVRIDKKKIELEDKEINLIIWDIAGEVSQEKVNTTYYLGAAAVIYVFDISRPNTYENLEADLAYVKNILPKAKFTIVGNKVDLNESPTQPIEDCILTSAKTGQGVEEMFLSVAKQLL